MQIGVANAKTTDVGTTWSVYAGFLRDILRESRVTVQVVFLLRFCTAALLTAPVLEGRALAAALAWALATLAIYVFNGVMDVTEDRANCSTRPISQGSLPVPVAAGGAVTAAGIALAFGGVVDSGGILPLLILAHLVCGYAYSGEPFYGKRRGATASALILTMGALTYIAAWHITGRHDGLGVLVLGVAMSLWMAGVGALAKDLSDVVGDETGGRRTPAIAWGDPATRLVLTLNAAVIAVGFLAASWVSARVLVPSALCLVLGALTVGVFAVTTRTADIRSVRRLPYQAFMATQYAVHVVALATLVLLNR